MLYGNKLKEIILQLPMYHFTPEEMDPVIEHVNSIQKSDMSLMVVHFFIEFLGAKKT